MIEREAIPKAARTGTVAEFCIKHDIDESTYYYQSRKDENQKKSLRIALALVKKRAPDILEKLAERAEAGDMKATDMFLNYVLELSKNLDLKTGGERFDIFDYAKRINNRTDNSDQKDNGDEEKNQGDTRGNISQ